MLYVVDPLFSLSLVVGALVLLLRKKSKVVKTWAALAVFTSCIYLFMAIFNKASVQTTIKKSLLNQNIVYSHLLVTPTPFNSFLWYIIAANDSGYYIGYRSVFDKKDVPVKYTYFKKNPLLLREAASEVGVKKLIQFAGDYYTVEKKERSLVVNVLRFGQILGWEDPDAQFALPFVVNAGNENTFIVQRGRFKGWNWRTISRMYYRIEH
jgi:inner membrane protein